VIGCAIASGATMATLMLSVGVPMISGGDGSDGPRGQQQRVLPGQRVSWTSWELPPSGATSSGSAPADPHLEGTPVLRRRNFSGTALRGADVSDIAWLDPSGREMTDDTWSSPDVRCLGVRLNGDAIDEVDERGNRIVGDTLVLILNAGEQPVAFTLPATAPEERWEALIDTADPWAPPRRLRSGGRYELLPRSVAVLKLNCRKEDLRRAEDWGPMGVC
jgi:glycogen operon protein